MPACRKCEVSRSRPSLFADSTVTLSVLSIRAASQDRWDAGGFCINTLNQRKRKGNRGGGMCGAWTDSETCEEGRGEISRTFFLFFFLENRLRAEREREPRDL